MKKIVVFGVGKFYQNRKGYLKQLEDVAIVGYIDNNKANLNKQIDGGTVSLPDSIHEMDYDAVLVMSVSVEAMKEQLVGLGVAPDKIWTWKLFYAHMQRGHIQVYGKVSMKNASPKILIVGHDLGYHGGSIAASYAARVLMNRGYQVVLAAPTGNKKFIEEMTDSGITIIICPALSFIHEEELVWISLFDMVIVNTFPMIISAQAISKVKPVLWWIHECSDRFADNYVTAQREFRYYVDEYDFSQIHISAVGELARENFNYYYPNSVNDILVYGIPDRYNDVKKRTSRKEKIVFALIGGFCERKAQKLWIQAIRNLSPEEKYESEFWLIGKVGNDEYSNAVLEAAKDEESIKICGQMTREEIERAFEEIDVVVCPSLEEIVPITITEGMMFEKICVVTSMSSTASYIRNGHNGFVCEAGNVEDLTEKMEWIIGNINSLDNIRKEARRTYEDIFSLRVFSDNLEKVIAETMEAYNNGRGREGN